MLSAGSHGSGSVFQIRVDGVPPPAQNALLYETVAVAEGQPILRDMVFSPDHHSIYLLSHRQVRSSSDPPQNQRPGPELLLAVIKPDLQP